MHKSIMKRDFHSLINRKFDLLVCGGGIYGAWVAYDAALRGLRVAIVEQSDWANATSSASSKLIHGGLRYLESFDFKLVKKALAERDMLLIVAPHRVWPLHFGVPVYANGRIGSLQLKAGLMIYDFLATRLNQDLKHHYLKREDFCVRFPFLKHSNLNSGFIYADAQTDDARLVLELIDGATQAGAVCVNYCKLTKLIETEGRAIGATVQDQLSTQTVDIHARQIVYATGQWQAGECGSRLTKGVHLVLPATGVNDALLLTAQSDGRVFFIIPWYGMTLVGTTDSDYRGDIERVAVEEADVNYLLAAVNGFLRTAWTRTDIVNSYAGLRVLKGSGNAPGKQGAPSSISRDWELRTAANGVHYSVGGKITSAREDAASIVNNICAQLGKVQACATLGKRFPWAPAGHSAPGESIQDEAARDHEWIRMSSLQAVRLGVDQESSLWLVRRHGQRVTRIFEMLKDDPQLARRIVSGVPLIAADLLFCAGHEMVLHLPDLLRRRLPLLILAKLTEQDIQTIAQTVAPIMMWDKQTINQEVSASLNSIT
ncbi:MAG: glycerol-3-phosphate dehydrogenase/oxidase [Candidatus Nitrotoga sp.]